MKISHFRYALSTRCAFIVNFRIKASCLLQRDAALRVYTYIRYPWTTICEPGKRQKAIETGNKFSLKSAPPRCDGCCPPGDADGASYVTFHCEPVPLFS